MIMFLVFGFFLLFLVLVIYFILKKSGYRKLAITILSIFIIVVFLIFNLNTVDEIMYFKSDAKEDLRLVDINLKDDFEIIENDVDGFPERHQKTILKISESDKKKIISEIKNDNYFQECKEERSLFYKTNGKESKRLISNYVINDRYFKESYEQQLGFAAINVYVTLKENSNNIELNRIED